MKLRVWWRRRPSVAWAIVAACTVLLVIAGGSVLVADAGGADTSVPDTLATPFFASDFEHGTLAPWDNLDIGEGTVPVSTTPPGSTALGTVRVTNVVAARGSRAVELTVTPSARASPAAGMNSVYLWNVVRAELGHEGQETWQRFRVRFPQPVAKGRGVRSTASFVPNRNCHGGCPWFAEYHNDDSYLPFYRAGQITWEYPNLVWGVDTSRRVVKGPRQPQIFMRVWGGDDNTPAEPSQSRAVYVYTGRPLRYNHWYAFRAHIRWSPDPTVGLVEWWLDGKRLYSQRAATLWRHPDGSVSMTNFELVNYRVHDDTVSTIFFDDIRLGTTAASVDR